MLYCRELCKSQFLQQTFHTSTAVHILLEQTSFTFTSTKMNITHHHKNQVWLPPHPNPTNISQHFPRSMHPVSTGRTDATCPLFSASDVTVDFMILCLEAKRGWNAVANVRERMVSKRSFIAAICCDGCRWPPAC
jgi:hypothetical protein